MKGRTRKMHVQYSNVKVSTLIDRINHWIQEKGNGTFPEREYHHEITKLINRYLRENGYPIRCVTEFSSFNLYTDSTPSLKILELRDRYTASKGPVGRRQKIFRRFVKSGPGFGEKISTLMDRRFDGITYQAEESLYEIRSLGYDTPEKMMDAFEEAKKTVDRIQYIQHRYLCLSEEEKEAIRKLI